MFYIIQYEEPPTKDQPYAHRCSMTADAETFEELTNLLKDLHNRIDNGEEIERIVINVLPF
jgi:hypothetical protein